jgi:arylsulfatase A-like enzyme
MWTGRHAKDVGLWDTTNFAWTDVLDEEIPTVGTMLREQGYYTAFKGKWHLSHQGRVKVRNGPTDLRARRVIMLR